MRPDYKIERELSEKERAVLSITPSVRFGVGQSTLEKPYGITFTLPLGLVSNSSKLLADYFANTDPNTGSLASAVDIYLLPSAKPEHFDVLAAYIRHGHGMLKTNLGKSILATTEVNNGDRIYTVVDIGIDLSKVSENHGRNERVYKILSGTLTEDAVERTMPQAIMFLDAAEDVNTFVALCDKLDMNRAAWTALMSYGLIIRFAIIHDIPFSPSSEEMMPWGPLGDALTMKNEEVRSMMPKAVLDMWKERVEEAYALHITLKGIISRETKVYLGLDGSDEDSI